MPRREGLLAARLHGRRGVVEFRINEASIGQLPLIPLAAHLDIPKDLELATDTSVMSLSVMFTHYLLFGYSVHSIQER